MPTEATQPSPDDIFWARVKPLNVKKGYVRGRHVIGSNYVTDKNGEPIPGLKGIDRTWRGGDGIHEIPDWVKINRLQGELLMTIHQVGGDEDTPLVFDIVSPELKARIDAKEEDFRRSVLGYGRPITEMPNVRASERDIAGIDSVDGRPTLDDIASGKTGATSVLEQAVNRTPTAKAAEVDATRPAVTPADVAVPGRQAAAEGFDGQTVDLSTADLADSGLSGDDGDDDGDEGLPPVEPPG
jgi:hypothetical protein